VESSFGSNLDRSLKGNSTAGFANPSPGSIIPSAL
jgi:hypothetical protein